MIHYEESANGSRGGLVIDSPALKRLLDDPFGGFPNDAEIHHGDK
jgi:hypothetical protein